MTIQRIGIAVQLPDKIIEDIRRVTKDINIDNVMHSFMSEHDYVVNDFNTMLCDYLTDKCLDQPGHFDEAIENYSDTVLMLFKNEHALKNSWDADQCKRKADEYISAAIDFTHELIRSGQFSELENYLNSIKDKQHTIIMPAKLVMHDDLGTFITRYDVMPVDECHGYIPEAF